MVYVVEKLVMSPDEICGFVIGDICGTPYNPYHNWRVAFPPLPKPPVPLPEPPPVSLREVDREDAWFNWIKKAFI